MLQQWKMYAHIYDWAIRLQRPRRKTVCSDALTRGTYLAGMLLHDTVFESDLSIFGKEVAARTRIELVFPG
jgi:hypothetical protein